MAEAGGNLSIMGWGATLLSYAIASMAYAGLFTTEPWETGGFGTISFLVFFIGIIFFLIGLAMQIFGGKETETAAGAAPAAPTPAPGPGGPGPGGPAPAPGGPGGPRGPPPGPSRWRRVRNFFGRRVHNVGQLFRGLRGAPPTPGTPAPGTPTPGTPAPGASRAGLPGPPPQARPGVTLVPLQKLEDWIKRLNENVLSGKKGFPAKDPILEPSFQIEDKIDLLIETHNVYLEVISAHRQISFLADSSEKLLGKDNVLRMIFREVKRFQDTDEEGEIKKIEHRLKGYINNDFFGMNIWLRKKLEQEYEARTGKKMPEEETGRAEEAPREEKPPKGLPPPKKKKPKKKKAEPSYAKVVPSDEEEVLLREEEEEKRRKRELVGV